MSSRNLSFTALFTLFVAFSAAAENLTLPQALRELDQSPRLIRAKSVADETSWRRVEAFSAFLPSVTAGASHLLGKKYVFTDIVFGGGPVSIPQILSNTTYSLTAQWLLFDGLANVERYRASRLFERAADREFEWTRFQSQREVILLFYRALGAQTLKEVAEQNLKTLNDHLGDVELLKRTGVSTKYDVLRVEVQTSEAKSELLNADDNVMVSLLRLGELLGKDPAPASISGKLPVLTPELIANLSTSEANRKRPDLEALEERAQGVDELAAAAAKHWFPKVSLFGQFQEYNNLSESLTSDLRDAYSVGVQLSWELFNGFASRARDRQAAAQSLQTEKALEMSRSKAGTDIEFWKRKYLYFCSVYRARQSDIGKATESVRLAREGRKVGARTNTDLLDAELELFRARAGLVNSQVGAIEALVNLEMATGQALYSFGDSNG